MRDVDDLKELYERYAGRAMAIAIRVLGSRAEAEEVVQEAFVHVWKNPEKYDPARGATATWVTVIVRSRAIDRLRARGAQARAVGGAEKEAEVAAASMATPLEDLERIHARARIRHALRTLPPEQRNVVELAYFEGLSHSQIAARIAEPLGTVKSRLRRAMETLADRLSGDRPAEPATRSA